MFGGAVILGGGYESIKKALGTEKIEASLRTTLKNTGQLHANTMQQITSSSARLATHGGFSQQEQLKGITQLVGETGSHTAAVKLNAAAVNLARGENLEYSAALKMVSMGVTGSTGRLQKYLGIIQPVKTAIDRVKESEAGMTTAQKATNSAAREAAELQDKRLTALKVAAITEAKYHGATAAFSKTTAGHIQNLKNAFEGLEETVGKRLVPGVTKLLTVGSNVVTWVLKSKVALIALGGAVGLLMVAFAVEKVIRFVEAVKALTLVTKLQTGAQWLLDAALDANPIGLVVVGVAALVAILYVAYTKVAWFRQGVQAVWTWVKAHWPLLAGIVLGPFVFAAIQIVTHWTAIVGFFKGVPGKLAAAGKGMWSFVKTEFKSVIDWILRGWNRLHFKMPGVHTPFGTIGGFNIGLPQIPLLGEGGTVRERGSVVVGDRGPELLSLPPGARVDPLLPGSRSQGAPGTFHHQGRDLIVICQIDRKEVGRAVVDEIDREFARGNR
ncbi:MAG TPA: hypothetical protein VK756_07810 [Solirubrobacteraceae bacterium]|nr:hypothetical protein [Solirubrobacteraceae bacterium]